MTDEDRIFALDESDLSIDVVSGSSLNTFLRCAKQWEYAYVYKFRRPPALRMVTGTAGHKGIEVHLLAKRETHTDEPLDVALDAYSTSYDLEVIEAEATDKDRGEWKDKGARSVKLWHKEVAPKYQPSLVEQPVSFTLNGLPYTGTIDATDEDDVLTDWKFVNQTPRSADAYLINLVGYALGYRVLTGKVESRVELDHMVALKTPKVVPIRSDGPVTDAAIAAFADTVDSIVRSIKAGAFPANGLKSGACSWCGYRDICPAYKESPLRTEPKEVELIGIE